MNIEITIDKLAGHDSKVLSENYINKLETTLLKEMYFFLQLNLAKEQ